MRGVVEIRNLGGNTCILQGFPTLFFLSANGQVLPGFVARASDTPPKVVLTANQPPVPPYGAPEFAYFEVLGTTHTAAEQPCPADQLEQPAQLRVVLPGPVELLLQNSSAGASFSSCNGRIQIGPVMPGTP